MLWKTLGLPSKHPSFWEPWVPEPRGPAGLKLSREVIVKNYWFPTCVKLVWIFSFLTLNFVWTEAVVNIWEQYPTATSPNSTLLPPPHLAESYTKYFICSNISQVCLLFAKMIPSMFMKIPTVIYWHLGCNNVHMSIRFSGAWRLTQIPPAKQSEEPRLSL